MWAVWASADDSQPGWRVRRPTRRECASLYLYRPQLGLLGFRRPERPMTSDRNNLGAFWSVPLQRIGHWRAYRSLCGPGRTLPTKDQPWGLPNARWDWWRLKEPSQNGAKLKYYTRRKRDGRALDAVM